MEDGSIAQRFLWLGGKTLFSPVKVGKLKRGTASTAFHFWSFGVNWPCRGSQGDGPGWMTHMCFSLACLGASLFPAWGFSVPRVLDQHTHPLKRSGCEKVPELPLPRRQWVSQLSPSLVQLLRRKVRISRSCVQIRAAETCSSAPLEMCENANQVQVSGGFRCSNKEFSACFFLVGQESTRLQLCCFDRLVNVRAGITGGSRRFGSWTLSVYDRTAEVHWETISALFIVRH